MNANLAMLNIPLTLTINLDKGKYADDFQHIFNEHVGLIGTIETKSQHLSEIAILSAAADSPEATRVNLQIVTAAFSALLGEKTPSGESILKSNKMTEMMLGLLQDCQASGKSARELENVRFTARKNKDADIVFVAEPVR
ncbi:hypothetical protein [Pectobacterium sp. CFBP8739]